MSGMDNAHPLRSFSSCSSFSSFRSCSCSFCAPLENEVEQIPTFLKCNSKNVFLKMYLDEVEQIPTFFRLWISTFLRLLLHHALEEDGKTLMLWWKYMWQAWKFQYEDTSLLNPTDDEAARTMCLIQISKQYQSAEVKSDRNLHIY